MFSSETFASSQHYSVSGEQSSSHAVSSYLSSVWQSRANMAIIQTLMDLYRIMYIYYFPLFYLDFLWCWFFSYCFFCLFVFFDVLLSNVRGRTWLQKTRAQNNSKTERRKRISGPAKPSRHERGLAILNERTKTEEWTLVMVWYSSNWGRSQSVPQFCEQTVFSIVLGKSEGSHWSSRGEMKRGNGTRIRDEQGCVRQLLSPAGLCCFPEIRTGTISYPCTSASSAAQRKSFSCQSCRHELKIIKLVLINDALHREGSKIWFTS